MHLVLANKLYSSWSMRPWLVMKAIGLDFDETVIPLRQDDTAARIRAFSPTGKVPVLIHDDGAKVWDSLAIISWLSDLYPDKPIWPADIAARGHAKAISCEMHSGFQALRQACPMNLGKLFRARAFPPEVMADVARIAEIWADTRERFGLPSGEGPYLFGRFSAADAMYAPVVARLSHYRIAPGNEVAEAYMAAVESDANYRAWVAAALAEPWRIPAYEEGHQAEADLTA